MFKKILASATMVAVLTGMLGTTAFATEATENGSSTEVGGSSYPIEATISVVLPGELAFAINPLYLDADGDPETTGDNTQIVSGEYQVINYSNTAVIVTSKTKVELGENVQIANAFNTVTNELAPASGKKNIYLVQQLPTAIAVNEDVASFTTSALTVTSGSVSNLANVGKDLSTSDVTTVFGLAAYNGTGLAATNVGGYKLTGAVDPAANFVEGDVKLISVFTLDTVTDEELAGAWEADAKFKSVVTAK